MRINALNYNQKIPQNRINDNSQCSSFCKNNPSNHPTFKGAISVCVPKSFAETPECLAILEKRITSLGMKIREKYRRKAIRIIYSKYEFGNNVVNSITFDPKFDNEGKEVAAELQEQYSNLEFIAELQKKYSDLKSIVIKFSEKALPQRDFITFGLLN